MESWFGTLLLLGLVATLQIVSRLKSLERRVAALSQLDAKVDLLLAQAGLEFDPFKNVPPGVVTAITSGNKIEAIKQYRAATGVGLVEAKEFVEAIERRAGK